ncbi:MAG: HD domain-containing protein, partial [Actinomycetota bacterium]|nr:HD domain-containing protein [Actinomycetota bacterium]
TQAETTRAVAVLSHDAGEVERHQGLSRLLKEADLPHVRVGEVRVFDKAIGLEGQPSEEARASYGGALQLMREIDRLVRSNRTPSTTQVKGVVRSLVDNVLQNRYAMLQLTGLKNYDEYTFYHSANVAILALALGAAVTTDYRFLSSLGIGALLHDIGKLTVDLEILNKPGALSPDEWANVRQHPVHGAEMAALMPGLDKSAIVIILEHHMRYDCAGYPQRVPARTQHLTSRIVAVADSYDAMTSRRAYSAARVQDEAMAVMVKSAGNSLDPALVRLFVRLMGVYPPRSVVRLSSGEVGVVVTPSPLDPVRPLIRVITTPDGAMIDPHDLDLGVDAARSIIACLDPRGLNIEPDDYV